MAYEHLKSLFWSIVMFSCAVDALRFYHQQARLQQASPVQLNNPEVDFQIPADTRYMPRGLLPFDTFVSKSGDIWPAEALHGMVPSGVERFPALAKARDREQMVRAREARNKSEACGAVDGRRRESASLQVFKNCRKPDSGLTPREPSKVGDTIDANGRPVIGSRGVNIRKKFTNLVRRLAIPQFEVLAQLFVDDDQAGLLRRKLGTKLDVVLEDVKDCAAKNKQVNSGRCFERAMARRQAQV